MSLETSAVRLLEKKLKGRINIIVIYVDQEQEFLNNIIKK